MVYKENANMKVSSILKKENESGDIIVKELLDAQAATIGTSQPSAKKYHDLSKVHLNLSSDSCKSNSTKKEYSTSLSSTNDSKCDEKGNNILTLYLGVFLEGYT